MEIISALATPHPVCETSQAEFGGSPHDYVKACIDNPKRQDIGAKGGNCLLYFFLRRY